MSGSLGIGNPIVAALLMFASASMAFGQDYVPGEVIVKLKGKSSSASAAQFMGKIQGKLALKTSFDSINVHRMSLKTGDDLNAVIQQLKTDPAVEYAEPNYILRKSEESLSAGELMSLSDVQAQMQTGDTYVQSYANTGVQQAWPIEATLAQNANKVIVAVIDTGVDYNHTVFRSANSMWRNTAETAGNGVDDDGNGYIDDLYGWNFYAKTNNPMDDDEHGTHVAGIIVGLGQDIFPTVWEDSKIQIMALKFLNKDGAGSTADAIAAIYYAVANGAKVINNSWGGSNYSQALHEALSHAYDRKVVIVSAAGNYGKNNDVTGMYPANYPVPGQISVAATTDYDNLASFSNYGLTTVQVTAPGVSILSTIPGDSYRYMSGTSMATPFVSGLAAMVLREAPNITGYQVRNIILNTSTGISALLTKIQSHGRADAYDAIAAARSQVNAAAYQPAYKPEVRSLASGGDASAQSGPKGCGTVTTALLYRGGGGPGASGGGDQTSTDRLVLMIALTLLPMIAWQILRARSGRTTRRRYDRFLMNSAIRMSVEGREMVGHLRTISEGGLSFEANTLLEKGGILTMNIQSPDGKENIQVQGHIVWNEENKAYGVKFDEVRDTVIRSIRQWTQRLVRVADY